MDPIAESGTSQKVGKTRKRSEKEKKKRRSREKGPHPCPLCDHAPFKSISGLRAHIIGIHRKHCSWTKKISGLKLADVTDNSRPVRGVNDLEVRVLHMAGPLPVEISEKYDVDNGEKAEVIDPAIVESLEAFIDELPLSECWDVNVEPLAAGPGTMPPPLEVNTVSTETLTDEHGPVRMRSHAIQTPRSAEFYLPVSIKHLVRLVRESNGGSVADMLRHLGLDHGGFRTDEMQILTLVLDAVVEARHDLIKTVIEGHNAAKEAEEAAPYIGSLQTMADLMARIDVEFRRPRPNPWPKTTAEVDEELIHLMTSGVAAAIAAENATAVIGTESEVTLIDSE